MGIAYFRESNNLLYYVCIQTSATYSQTFPQNYCLKYVDFLVIKSFTDLLRYKAGAETLPHYLQY